MLSARLTIVAGENEGHAVAIASGQTATVGRLSAKNQLSVPDRYLAPRHFAVRCDQHVCTLQDVSQELEPHTRCAQKCFVDELRNTRCPGTLCVLNDLSARSGVRVNGEQVVQRALADGDLISAGSTVFMVNVAREPLASAAPVLEPNPFVLDRTQQDRALAFINEAQMPLFAVLDAARAPEVHHLLLTHDAVYYSLYDGPEAERYVEVAPYLVELPPASRLTEALVREHWGWSFGYFFFARSDFKSVRRHLRKFLIVEGGQKKMYFRFYDPRVLRAFLPTCTPDECAEFFGPITHFFCEAEQPRSAWLFSRGSVGLRSEAVRL